MNDLPDPVYKAQPEKEEKSSHFRTILVALATCTLLAGAGVHFIGPNNNTSSHTPAAAGAGDNQGADASQQRMGIQLSLIAPEKAAEALASSGYSEKEQADILAGVKRRDLRLVAMPIFDATGTGGTVNVVCGTMHRTVALQTTPTVLILPISVTGNVDILPVSDPGIVGIGSGVITMFGPQVLPVMHQGDSLGLTVIAQ
ncbi:hypothetical protein [Acetobacter indonesiensis]|uniref:hypothetical protein n=1 Tax=Acetobacter indonesiensis TaxID=104101 RepID=UPI0020A5745A|nr:hypothetical protein [Acetobacter indonesiensis]MCP1230329.1 hypothetical protein [Acetobacter indonesiensis]